MPLRQPMPVLFVGEPLVLGFAPIQFKPAPQLAGADSGHFAKGVALSGSMRPCVAAGIGMIPENTETIRVLTITITAPQQVHRIGARSLNHAIA